MEDLKKQKSELENLLKKLGYHVLRTSVFNSKNEAREEWQVRIDYDENTGEYVVYSLADRASLIGKVNRFLDYEKAKKQFLRKLELTIEYNRLQVKDNEIPEYSCSLWDK